MNWWEAARDAAHEHGERVMAQGGGPMATADRTALAHRFLLRSGLIAALTEKGWFQFEPGEDYLPRLYARWREDPGPYRLWQRLSMLFYSGVNQPSERARQLVAHHIGRVPFLGSGLFCREPLEGEPADGECYCAIPDQLPEWFFACGIPLARATIREEPPASLVDRSRQEVADYVQSRGSSYASLMHLHRHDPDCGDGTSLACLMREIVLAASPRLSPAETSHLAGKCLSGVGIDPLLVQEARFRLATVALALQDGAEPAPLPDLRNVIRLGVTLPASSGRKEGPRLEFKASFEWNPRTGQASGDLRLGVLKTIAAFMNSDGGTLLLGVQDDGSVCGLAHELNRISDPRPRDVFEGRLREAAKSHIDPPPLSSLRVTWQGDGDHVVCQLDVEPRPGVTYLLRKGQDGRWAEDVYVRDGNRTLSLAGRTRDQFVLGRSGP